ncbi:serine hydrolase domain-containing protein [Paenibacillus sedimenti]|uniref:Serine hydrolase n=1 Tax=Paenibacillus sedimenti TaxID=2770274 RepID=A0A926KV10_9BACL|nr:serine hydrolase [Paenibacillus sedimenti]MBD0384692.1 serine hydrolase [Paenibacillus sedimenti]
MIVFNRFAKLIMLAAAASLILTLSACSSEKSSLPVTPPVSYKVFNLPNGEWQIGTPDQVGMDLLEVDEVIQYAKRSPQILSMLVVKDGTLVTEYYRDGMPESKRAINSITKSVTSLLIGIAIDKSYLKGINEPIESFFPEYKDMFDSSDKRSVTLEHLLNMTSGLHFPEWTEWNYSLQPLKESKDWNGFVLSQPMDAKPGEMWNYNTGGSQLLAAILKRTTGQSELAFAKEHLFGPLGINSVEWPSSPDNSNSGGFGLKMTPRDLGKIGLLVLNRGVWNGKRLVSESWLRDSTSRHSGGSTFFGEYGYHWWLNQYGGHKAIFGMGYAGQYLTVVPDLNLVIVINSAATKNPQDTTLPIPYIEKLVIAVKDR